MNRIFSRRLLPVVSAAFFCVLVGIPDPARAVSFREGASFWNPPASTAQCGVSFDGLGSYSLSRILTRQAWPNDTAVNFAGHYGMWLAQAIAGRNIAANKARILDAAARMAFTKPDMKPGWSPIYVQSNLIRLTAMYIVTLERRGQLAPEERATLIAWGDAMIPGQKSSRNNKSADSLMASGVAMIAWGSVTGDKRLMSKGYSKFMKGFDYVLTSAGNLKRHAGHRGISTEALSLEDEYNVALQHAVEGAAILRNLGVDVTGRVKGGNNLHSAVAWWAGVMATRPAAFQGMRAWSHNFHIGWIPVYLHFHSDQPVAGQLRSLARSVNAGRRPSFRAISLGGATDCLW